LIQTHIFIELEARAQPYDSLLSRRATGGPARLGRPTILVRGAGDDPDTVSEVIIGEGESFEAALRRFNKKIQQAGILAEARRREFYERPAQRRKRKEAKRRKR